MGLSLTVSEINDAISVENRKFFRPSMYLTPPEWIPLGIGYRLLAHGVKKLELCGYRAEKEV